MNASGKKTTKRKIDYELALRDVAKSMVRLKRPERLLKLITRFIDRELGLTHTSIVVREEKKDRFTFVDSKGSRRLPIGLIKFDLDHPLVMWFQNANKEERLHQDCLDRRVLSRQLANGRFRFLVSERRYIFERVKKAMDDLKIELAIPGFYKERLIGMLLLGAKKDGARFFASEVSFFQTLTQDCAMAVMTAEYHRSLMEKNAELEKRLEEIETLRKKEQQTYYEIMRSLAQEVHAKDPYTFGHISQVERLGLMTAQELGMDLSGRRRDILSAALILHDVGKIGIPDHILQKAGPLTEEEWKIMRTHVDKGAKILEPLTDFREVAEIIRCHHERFDGSGYPRGLRGEQIPLEARIICVVDTFHAMVSTRCYSKGRSVEAALEELRRCGGTHFDPEVVEAFIRALQQERRRRGAGSFDEDPRDSLTKNSPHDKSSFRFGS